MSTKLVTLQNLTTYDGKIKEYIGNLQAKNLKTVLYDSTEKQIKFFKKENATLSDTADYAISIPADLDASAVIASVSSGVVTLKAGLQQQDGIISNTVSTAPATEIEGYYKAADGKFYQESTFDTEIVGEANKAYIDKGNDDKAYIWDGEAFVAVANDITLAKVATTGAAADVTITAITGVKKDASTNAGNVQEALEALKTLVDAGGSGSMLTIDEDTTDNTVAKKYHIYQGGTKEGGATTTTGGTLIGTISVPLDLVCESGSVVNITFDETNTLLKEGSTDVTESILGTGVTPTAADAGKYIKITIANSNGDILWIKATDLVDIYTATNQTSEVTVSISSNNITASIGDVAASKITYTAAVAGVGSEGDIDYVAPVARVSVSDAISDLYSQVGSLGSSWEAATTSDIEGLFSSSNP